MRDGQQESKPAKGKGKSGKKNRSGSAWWGHEGWYASGGDWSEWNWGHMGHPGTDGWWGWGHDGNQEYYGQAGGSSSWKGRGKASRHEGRGSKDGKEANLNASQTPPQTVAPVPAAKGSEGSKASKASGERCFKWQ
ncbi:unnamed protein product [Symbiodinium natans]|uniref:Uncharacterized protein n=1 Tax=Symbiodinium natans TaxID=878477 RepID=A0A812SNV2_9DINO|nr:unnamed protein product [Symbiodinium natans]